MPDKRGFFFLLVNLFLRFLKILYAMGVFSLFFAIFASNMTAAVRDGRF